MAPKATPPMKEVKENTTDPESGYFVKNERERVFAYSWHTACDRNGLVLGVIVEPSHVHDRQVFQPLLEKVKTEVAKPGAVAVDAGYKTPYISKILLEDDIRPVMPYTRPKTKKGCFRKHEYVYDAYYDCYLCPQGQVLTYRTTTREGYRSIHIRSADLPELSGVRSMYTQLRLQEANTPPSMARLFG